METIIIILLSLIIEFLYEPIKKFRNEDIFKRIYDLYNSYYKLYLENKAFSYISCSIIIVIFITIIINIVAFIHPLLSFVTTLLILLFCFSPNEFNQKIEDFKFIIENDQNIEKSDILQEIAPNLKKINLKNNLLESISKSLFFNSTRNIFNILFWFLLLGAGGALGYRILDTFAYTSSIKIDQKSRIDIKKILGIIEFIPIRLSIYAFAVVGNFENALQSLKTTTTSTDIYQSNVELITNVGEASSRLPHTGEEENVWNNKISYIQTLIARALLAWLSIILLLVFGGFFI